MRLKFQFFNLVISLSFFFFLNNKRKHNFDLFETITHNYFYYKNL